MGGSGDSSDSDPWKLNKPNPWLDKKDAQADLNRRKRLEERGDNRALGDAIRRSVGR